MTDENKREEKLEKMEEFQTLKDQVLFKSTKIIEICTTKDCQDYFGKLNLEYNGGIFGLDVEFENTNYHQSKDWVPALIQVATSVRLNSEFSDVVLIRIKMIKRNEFADSVKSIGNVNEKIVNKFPHSVSEFINFLENPKFIKTGVAVLDDAVHISKLLSCNNNNTIESTCRQLVSSCVDLRHLMNKTKLRRTKHRDLATLTKYFLGITLSRSPGNWTSFEPELSHAQKYYAAADSFFSLQLFYRFWNHRLLTALAAPGKECKEEIKEESNGEKKEASTIVLLIDKCRVVCSPLYCDIVNVDSIDKDKKGESDCIQWIGDSMNKNIIVNQSWINQQKQLGKTRNHFMTTEEKNPRIQHLSKYIKSFPIVDSTFLKWQTCEFEHLETLAMMNLESRICTLNIDETDIEDKKVKQNQEKFRHLVKDVVEFCHSWRCNEKSDEVLNKMLENLKSNADEIDKLRKSIGKFLKNKQDEIKAKSRRIYLEK
jgi:hypothetical protein